MRNGFFFTLYVMMLTFYLTEDIKLSMVRRHLVVFVIENVRWDYIDLLQEKRLGGFKHFMNQGIRTEYVEPIFPSISYPSWTTLSTGMYPENHGIIGNIMYDVEKDLEFNHTDDIIKQPFWWENVEPIWTTATKAGLKVATIEFSRSDIPIHGVLPEVYSGFNVSSSKSLRMKIDDAVQYLKQNFDFIIVYCGNADTIGLNPGSDVSMNYLENVGIQLDYFFDQVMESNMGEYVDTILVSHHSVSKVCGMPKLDISAYINIPTTMYHYIDDTMVFGIFTLPEFEEDIYDKLKNHQNYTIYYRDEIPVDLHYADSERTPDIILLPKMDYFTKHCLHYQNNFRPDWELTDLRGLFMGYGGSFHSNYPNGKGLILDPIALVDVYQIFCHILKVPAQPHNGSWERVQPLLSRNKTDWEYKSEFTNVWDQIFTNIRKNRGESVRYLYRFGVLTVFIVVRSLYNIV